MFDEKRQQIKVGDQIEFSKLPKLQEKLLVDVIELYRELFEETGISCDDIKLDHFMDLNYFKYENNLQVYYGIYYIGNSTNLEIDYAKKLGKEVLYYTDLIE